MKKDLENIFSAAATKGKLEQIKTLFEQTGNADKFNLDKDDLAMLVTFDDGGNATTYESIADNIHKKYNEIQLKKENINQENIIRDYFGDQNFNATGDNDGIVGANGSNQDNDENLNLVREETGLINNGASGSATNNAIDNRKNSLNDENLGNFTRMSDPVQKGDCLWNLAKKALQDEGKSYTNKDILERCAYIAKANNLTKKDKNDNLIIYPNRTYIVGFAQTEAGGTTVVAGGTTVEADGTTVEADGTTVEAGGTTVKAGGTTVVAGGTTVVAGGTTVEADGTTVEAGGTTVKAGGTTIVAGGTTVVAGGTTVVAGGTNPTNLDVQTIEEANNAVKEKLKQQLGYPHGCKISGETYDNTGKLISFVLKQAGWRDRIIELSYGDDGKLVAASRAIIGSDGTVDESYDNTYDEDGKVLTVVKKGSDGVVDWKENYTYDADGKMTNNLETYYEDDGETVDYTCDYIYDENDNVLTKVKKDSDGLVDYTYDYTYDANDNVLTKVKKDSDGVVDYTYDYTYGDNGKLIGMVETSYFSDGDVYYTINHTYDENGNVSTVVKKGSDGVVDRKENYTYDADGNKTNCLKTYYEADGVTADYTYDYTYDADGNKTNCLKTHYEADGETVDYTENYTYDEDGNETNRLVTYYYYEADGETVDYTENYTYDADGNKTKMVTKKYDSNVLIEEIEDNYDSNGTYIGSTANYSSVADLFLFKKTTIYQLKRELSKEDFITKDNIKGLLLYWKKKNPPSNFNTGIIERMDKIAGGASVAQMEKIPQALMEYAKDKLDENNSALLALQEFMNDSSRVEKGDDPEDNDYAKGRANELDGLMDAVMKELGWM